jgi:hypothetical protein
VKPSSTTTYTLTVKNAAGTTATVQATVTVVPAPSITSFTFQGNQTTLTITQGVATKVGLKGSFTNGTGSIDQSVGPVTSPFNQNGISVSSTTTYTLTVTNAAGTQVTALVTVTAVPAPTITSFTAASTTITAGTTTTLTGAFSDGTGVVTINGSSNPVPITSGTPLTVSPPGVGTTDYTLTVTNAAGTTVTRSASVTTVAAPVISSFTADALTITDGASTRLHPVFLNGVGTISPTVGAVTSGNAYSVSPASDTQTAYTLTVTNSVGAVVTSSLTITTVAAPAITSFTATPNPIVTDAGVTSSMLSYTFTGGTGTISPSVGAVTSGGSAQVSPATSTVYTLSVENGAGTVVTSSIDVLVQ